MEFVDLADLLFQHTAARRRLMLRMVRESAWAAFQHTAARRRLTRRSFFLGDVLLFQHTAARRRLNTTLMVMCQPPPRFNTQPPEGG